jgi:indole-3-glycerol phosphate synthase
MILDTIVARKKEEVKSLLEHGYALPEDVIEPPRGFKKALTDFAGVALIAEVKKASPSKGVICHDFDPVKIAQSYEEGGAQAVSVLTDEDFFQGHLSYLPLVRKKIGIPVLRKDFIIHEIQIRQAREYGADAILLIAAILEEQQIKDYLAFARELGLDVLVEVHDERELGKALVVNSDLIGINNRNLNDFSVSLDTTFRLKKLIPPEIPVVSESGIRSREDILGLTAAGVAAVLVGETLMLAGGQSGALKHLMGS